MYYCTRKLLLEWANKLQLIIQIEKPFEGLDNKSLLLNFITYKTILVVLDFLLDNKERIQNTAIYLTTVNNVPVFQVILSEIFKEFIDKDVASYKQEIENEERRTALWHLNNMRICDIFYLDEYICEFNKY